MNELIFLFHILFVMGFGLAALRLGKEALIAWIAIQTILANLFVVKQIFFFGFEVTCSDVFAIGCLFGLNLLQEYFGRKSAQKATWVCFFAMVFFALMSQFHLLYTPSVHDTTQNAFFTVLSATPRLLLASLATFMLVQQIDLRIFRKLSAHIPSFALRSGISLSLSQLLDTVLFSMLGLYGIVSSLFDVIFMSFILKMVIVLAMTPLTLFSRKFVPAQGDN